MLDDTVYTVKVKSGSTTELKIENEPATGNIQIVKVSSGYNEITGDKKGDGLEGAVFDIFNENLEKVDRIVTDRDGIATSKDLPLGKFVIREVQSPKYFYTDGKPFYAELKVSGDLVRFRGETTPVDLEVAVEKSGVAETMSGEVIRYTSRW